MACPGLRKASESKLTAASLLSAAPHGAVGTAFLSENRRECGTGFATRRFEPRNDFVAGLFGFFGHGVRAVPTVRTAPD